MDNTKQNLLKSVISDVFDSSASIDEIFQYFKKKSRPTYLLAGALTGRKPPLEDFFRYDLSPGLPLNAMPEEWDGELPKKYLRKLPYKFTKMTPMSDIRNMYTEDPVCDVLMKKKQWEISLISIKRALITFKRRRKGADITKIKKGVMRCPTPLVDLAARLEQDPDPQLNTIYNWYYAGSGNLLVMSVREADCVLHSDFSTVYLSKLSRKRLKVKREPITSYNCGDGNHILETICNENCIIGLRLKNKVIILNLDLNDENICMRKTKQINTDIICTGIAFDYTHKYILYVTLLDNTVKIINLDVFKSKTLNFGKPNTLVDNWNRVSGVNANYYAHIDRKTVTIYDKRHNTKTHSWEGLENISEYPNDHITAIKINENYPYMHTASEQHLYLMDLRYISDKRTDMLQRYNHHFRQPPTYISSTIHDSKQLMCLSSQFCSETCVVPNDLEMFGRHHSKWNITFPLIIPSLELTLQEAACKNYCVDIYNPIKPRLLKSITGNSVVELDNDYIVLTLNSLGDIFGYKLYEENSKEKDESLEKLQEWSLMYKNKPKTKYEVSDVIDISELWKALEVVPDDHQIGCVPRFVTAIKDEGLKFDESTLYEPFESEVLDPSLLELWREEETKGDKAVRADEYTIDHLGGSDSD